MDDQAHQLRKLVQTFRQAAEFRTGPPLFLVLSPRKRSDALLFSSRLADVCQDYGIQVSQYDTDDQTVTQVHWNLATLIGEFRHKDTELWQRASLCLLLTDSDDESIVASYKLLKQAANETPLPAVQLIVWADEDLAWADKAAKRLQQTCDQFLAGAVTRTTVCSSLDTFFEEHQQSLIERLQTVAPLSSTGDNIPLATHPTKQL